MKKKTIYIIMENQVRELNSIILFSIISSLRGYRTYIGTHYSILKLIKEKKKFGGIFIHKGSLTEESCKIVKNKCDKLAILDQEISPGFSNYWYDYVVNARIIKNTLQYVDKYYCINNQVKKIAINSLRKKNKKIDIISVGWPRFDVMDKRFNHVFKSQVNKLKKKYQNFILFNSDFGLISKRDLEIYDNTKIFTNKTKRFLIKNNRINKNFRKHAIKDFKVCKNFLLDISKKIKNLNLVIRPHPRESYLVWKDFCKKSKNFYLENPKYDVSSAILASKYVLHRGCTTGYQSLLAGKPTGYINLLKDYKKVYHHRSSLLKLSRNIKNIYSFKDWLKTKQNLKKNNKMLKNIVNIGQKYASEKILDDLDNTNITSELKHQKFKLYSNKKLKFLEFKNTIYDILAKLKFVKKRNFEQDLKIPKIQDNFTDKDIKKTLNLFLKSTVFRKNQKKIKIRKVTDALFEFDKI